MKLSTNLMAKVTNTEKKIKHKIKKKKMKINTQRCSNIIIAKMEEDMDKIREKKNRKKFIMVLIIQYKIFSEEFEVIKYKYNEPRNNVMLN